VLAEVVTAAALICLDPGHGTLPAVGRQREPIGPGSSVTKIKDPGGAPGEAAIALAIAKKTRSLLLRRGYRVAMTRTGATYRGGNISRARFCNRRRAALMLRIHADGAADASQRGIHTLTPAFHRGWTDDVYAASRRAAFAIQRSLVTATGARHLGVHERSDLTGFNWANVPVVLTETGFLTNPTERRLLGSGAYQWRVARGLVAGIAALALARQPEHQDLAQRPARRADHRERPARVVVQARTAQHRELVQLAIPDRPTGHEPPAWQEEGDGARAGHRGRVRADVLRLAQRLRLQPLVEEVLTDDLGVPRPPPWSPEVDADAADLPAREPDLSGPGRGARGEA
jgi:N-acetylmuramoyl-L-alanine amidase